MAALRSTTSFRGGVFLLRDSIRVFFFQAEDGIRDKLVTGVQTCALPIYLQAGQLDPGLARRIQECEQEARGDGREEEVGRLRAGAAAAGRRWLVDDEVEVPGPDHRPQAAGPPGGHGP